MSMSFSHWCSLGTERQLTVWKELELVGERLRFRRLSGTGPDEGQSEKMLRVLKRCFVEQVNEDQCMRQMCDNS